MTSGRDSFNLSYQVSPIILTGGIAKNVPGGYIPIINITEPGAYDQALLGPTGGAKLDDFFATYMPLPGATLVDNQIGQYPFANQSIAANAIITQPLRVSLLMMIPVRREGGYKTKTQTMETLQRTLAQHNNLAGTYQIATPAHIYTNCIMTSFRDISGGESKQAQNTWQMDFTQPLLTLRAAAAAMNLQMQKISSGLPIPGDPPKATGVGAQNATVATGTVPSLRPLAGGSAGQ